MCPGETWSIPRYPPFFISKIYLINKLMFHAQMYRGHPGFLSCSCTGSRFCKCSICPRFSKFPPPGCRQFNILISRCMPEQNGKFRCSHQGHPADFLVLLKIWSVGLNCGRTRIIAAGLYSGAGAGPGGDVRGLAVASRTRCVDTEHNDTNSERYACKS